MAFVQSPTKHSAKRVPVSYRPYISLLFAVAACCPFVACTSDPKVQNAAPAQSSPSPQSQQASAISAPQLSEIKEAVRRIFKDAAVIDSSRSPNSVIGDFNGDLSQDIAVILKPAPGKIRQMNEQFPPWIVKDPFVTTPRTDPLRISDGEVLLAVIHGFGPDGWRNQEATQTYLLKNAIGERLETRSKADVLAENQGKKLPQVKGDLIGEVLSGQSGYLYYAGSTYSWYNPATFAGEPAVRNVHPGFGTTKQN